MLATLLALVPQTQQPPAVPAQVRVLSAAKAPADCCEVGYPGVVAMVKFFAK